MCDDGDIGASNGTIPPGEEKQKDPRNALAIQIKTHKIGLTRDPREKPSVWFGHFNALHFAKPTLLQLRPNVPCTQ